MAIGDLYVDSDHIRVEGNDTLVIGSGKIKRDLSPLFNWWSKTDSERVPLIPLDENREPYLLCSGTHEQVSHYAPRRAFYRNKARKTGCDNLCRQCRHEVNETQKRNRLEIIITPH